MEISPAFTDFFQQKSKHHSPGKRMNWRKSTPQRQKQIARLGHQSLQCHAASERLAAGVQVLALDNEKCPFIYQKGSEFGILHLSDGEPKGLVPSGA